MAQTRGVDPYLEMGKAINGDGFKLDKAALTRILKVIKTAKSHEQLLLIEPRKTNEDFVKFNERVIAANRKLLSFLHPDKIKGFGLSTKKLALVEAARNAIDVAKNRLSSEENIREDRLLTNADGYMYDLFLPTQVRQYYPIGVNKFELKVVEVFPIEKSGAILQMGRDRIVREARKKQEEELKDQQEQVIHEEQEKLQEVKRLLDRDVLLAIQKRIQELNQQLDQEKIDIEACEVEFNQIKQAVNKENKGMYVRRFAFKSREILKEFEQLKDEFFKLHSEIGMQEEALRKKVNPLLDQQRVGQEKVRLAAEILKEDGELQVVAKPKQSGFLSFIKKHRKAILIIGIGLLVAIAIAATAGALAPTLAALPLVVGISFKLSMLAGAAITTKLILGTLIAAGAAVGGLVAAGITAAVAVVVGRFRRRPTVIEIDAFALEPIVVQSVPAVKLEEGSDDSISFKANPGTPGGLHTMGLGAEGLRRRNMAVPEEAPPAPSPKPGFSDIDVD